MRAAVAALLFASGWTMDGGAAELTPRTTQSQLTVVADLGGASALPYYRALNLLRSSTPPSAPLPPPKIPDPAQDEAAFLPVHSMRLTPGSVVHQLIRAPGLTPFFLAGDDPRSRAWINAHLTPLRQLGAVGFIVHVDSLDALTALRALAPGLTLVPASADDLAARLHLAHYPALVTATGIEQ
jgi:integrating conjugative element protein (TIGR03765 family)